MTETTRFNADARVNLRSKDTRPQALEREIGLERAIPLVLKTAVISAAIFFVIGVVCGLKLARRSASREMSPSSQHSEATHTDSPAEGTGSSYPTGSSLPLSAYRPEAEDVARHWERETGQAASERDVQMIQSIMKAVEDTEKR